MSQQKAGPPGLFDNLRGDLLGGVTAGIVALPLALAFGVASGIPNGAAAGLYGAIALGIFAALFGGTPAQVSGPTGPMTVVAAGLAVALKDHPGAIFLAVALAGALQIVLGAVRVGGVIRYVPYPVVSGFMTGIGVIIIVLHIPVLLGHGSVSNPLEAFRGMPHYLTMLEVESLMLGLGTIAIVYLAPYVTKVVPGTLLALVSMTVVAALLNLPVPTISAIPTGLPIPTLPPFDPEVLRIVLPAAVVLAILGSIDTLLTSLVADRITGTQHQSNRELVGQGIGNIAAGLIGGLPGAGATMRTVVNVKSGGRGRLSGVVHGLLLVGVLVGLAPLAQKIPLSVLAGLLITVGIGILDYRGLGDARKAPASDTAVMIMVLGLTIFVDLMAAVAAGVILSALVFAKRVGDQEPATATDGTRAVPVGVPGVHALHATQALFFGNAEALRRALDDVREGALILSLEAVEYLDQSAAYALGDAATDLRGRGVRVLLVAPKAHAAAAILTKLGVVPGVVPADDIYSSLPHAIEAASGQAAGHAPGPGRALRAVIGGDGAAHRPGHGEAVPTERRSWLAHIRMRPQVPATAFVHQDATVIGQVVMGDYVHVAAGSSVRADEGAPFFIGANSNVQDGAVLHALKERSVKVHGEDWAVYVGRDVSIAHGALVHGPCYVGDGTFIGFQAVVHDAVIGAKCSIGIGAVVVGVEVPPGKLVPHGTIVDTADKVRALPPVTEGHRHFAEDVVEVNRGLAAAYREHERLPARAAGAAPKLGQAAGWEPPLLTTTDRF
jgi:SulP family sulfate permease